MHVRKGVPARKLEMAEGPGGSDPQGSVFRPEAGRAPVQTGDSNHQRSASEGGSQMTSGKSTPEYCTVSKHISVIVHSLATTVDPGLFAQKLHEAGLVGRDIAERASVISGLTPAERIRPVIQAITARTELQASALHQFISILRSFNTLLADAISRAIDIEKQQLSKLKLASTATQADCITEAGTTSQSSMYLQADTDSALSGATPPQLATSGNSYVTSGKNSVEYRTISQHVSEVVHSLAFTVDPGMFAQKLHEAGLVESDVTDQASVVLGLTPAERIRPIIQAVLAQTELQASVFHRFIGVLRCSNHLLAGVLSKAIDIKRQQLSTLNSDSAATQADPITEKADTCTTSQSSMCLQADTDSALSGATPPQLATSGDIHHLHSPPGSSSPGIATVSASADQEMLDTGNLQRSDGAAGTQSKESTAVTPSEAQIGAGGSQVTSGKNTPEYCIMSKHISDVVYGLAITVDPGMFAQKLNEAGLVGSDITERASVVIGLTPTERIRPVIMAILAQTKLKASVFYQFISVLRSFNPLLANALSKAIAADDLHQPLSSFGPLYQGISVVNPSVGDQPLSRSASLAVPAQSLSSHSRTESLPAQYRSITGAVGQELAVTESNLLSIQKKFRHLKVHVRKKLENKQTGPEEIYEFVIDLYSCRVTDSKAFVIQVLGPVSEATLNSMFQALTMHRLWDFMNYHLLGGVISEFASDDNDLKIELKDYQKDLTGYELVTRIPMHLDVMKYNPTLSPEAEPNPELFAKLSIKVDTQISEHSVVYVIDLWESLAHHCRLPLPILLLREVAEGCISITLKIPAILAPHVASKARKLEDYYDNNHIQLVTLDGSTIYSVPQAELLTPMTAETQKDGQEDIPSPGGEHGGPAESAEIIKEPDMLPEFLRERLQTIALYRNFNMLYLHMDSPSVLPKLLHNQIIDAEKAEKVQFYTHKSAQNMKLFDALHNISFTSEVVLKLCEALNTTAGQETLGKKLLADFRHILVAHPLQHPQHIPGAQPSDLHEVTDEFVLTLHHVVSTFDQMSGALQSLKMILGSLVLPLENGDVLPLVEPQTYEHSHTVQELFGCLSNYYNPVSIDLLQAVTELSGCIEAKQKLSEYAATLGSKNHLLCVRHLAAGDKQNDLNAPSANQVISMGHKLAHEASLEKLQSHHPAMFSHFQSGSRLATRITAEIDKQAIFLSDYNDIVVAVCAMFQLPPLALVYIGCSTEPLVLAWSTHKDIWSYVTGNVGCSPTVGRMLVEQKVIGIAFGGRQYKCPSLKEVEYFEACTYGLVEKIPSLLQAGVSVNVTVVGDSGLLQAARRGKSEVVKFLLSASANPDQQYDDGSSPLLTAAQEGHEDVARLLLDAKADPNLPEKSQGTSPLIKASWKGYEGIVQLLIDAGADVNYQREDGMSALLFAAQHEHENIVRLLLDAKANPNLPEKTDGESPLINASWKGHESIVQLLIDAGADVNYQREDGLSPLLAAAQERHEDVARLLLDAKADPNLPDKTDGDSPLINASVSGYEPIVQLLIDAGADVNYQREDGVSALFFAAQDGHENIARLLLDAKANPNLPDKTQGDSPLIKASWKGYEGIVQLLIDAGAHVNYQREDGMSSLIFAAQEGHESILQLLLKAGANPNLQDKDGDNPLTLASLKGHHRVVEPLLENGADVNHQTIYGQTALTLATVAGHQRVVELLRNRADLNPQRRPDISVMMEQLALQMSMQGIPEQQQHHGMATETTGSSQPAELDISVMTEEEQLALALQMSMQGLPEQQHHDVATETAGRAQSAEDGMSLVTAAQRGQDNIVQQLLQKGANPNFQDKDGNTALILASSEGHLRVVEILLENGADLNLKTKGGMTAFDIASLEGYPEVCQVLLQCS